MDDSTHLAAQTIVAVALTYGVHSTMLIGAVWLAHRLGRITSHALSERMWKLSALLGLATAPLQMMLGLPSLNVTLPVRLSADNVPLASVAEQPDPQTHESESGLGTAGPRQIDNQEQHHDLERRVVTSNHRTLNTEQMALIETQLSDDRIASLQETTPSAVSPSDDPLPTPPARNSLSSASSLDATLSDVAMASPANTQASPTHARHIPSVDARSAATGNRLLGMSVGSLAITAFASLLILAIVVGTVRLVFQFLLLQRRFPDARIVETGPARRALDRLQRRGQLRRGVRLIVSDHCGEPLSLGLFRWTIALPTGLEQQLEKSELRALMAHELAHLCRGDIRWLWIGQLLVHCLAFQPLNRLARRRWQMAAEFRCDDWAVQQGSNQLALARCLTHVSQWRLDGPDCSLSLAATGSPTAVVQRVERLIQGVPAADRWATWWRQRLLVVTSLVVALGVVWGAPQIAFSIDAETPQSEVNNPTTKLDSPPNADVLATDNEHWRSLREQLVQLERELQQADELLSEFPLDEELTRAVEDLRERVASLQQHGSTLGRMMNGPANSNYHPDNNSASSGPHNKLPPTVTLQP